MKGFVYSGMEYYDMSRSERPSFCRFSVRDDLNSIEFYTNRDFEGMYIIAGGEIKEIQTVFQFALPDSVDSCRRQLKKMFLERFSH